MDARKHFQATGRNETEFARISDLIGLEEARDHAAGEANAAAAGNATRPVAADASPATVGTPAGEAAPGAPVAAPGAPTPAVDPRRADLERRRDEVNAELARMTGGPAAAPNPAP